MAICDYLDGLGVAFDRLLHPPTCSATRLAASLHLPGRQVAKGVVIRSGGQFVLAVLPATHSIDLERLRGVLGRPEALLAELADLEQIFYDCEPGALPPFGRPYSLPLLLDSSFVADVMVLSANLRHEVVRMRREDYLAIERPFIREFATVAVPKVPREMRRRAG